MHGGEVLVQGAPSRVVKRRWHVFGMIYIYDMVARLRIRAM